MDAERIHRDAVIIDAVTALLDKREYVESYKAGGVTCVAPTVGGETDRPATALKEIGSWLHSIRSRKDLRLVQKACDIEAAKRGGQMAILFHFQGTGPFETELN
ncbi:membrane dipeptidase, partial [Mesorhizobium sp. M1329]|uniref:membrane dipeptidase n=1 Tax=Mesorhizobium sp. M1329 TaxID=2957083 RepID=UPI0033353D46